MEPIPQVLVPLTIVPAIGDWMLTVRLHGDDKAIVDTACRAIGMSQGQFMRALLVNAGKKILADRGIRPRRWDKR